MSEQKNWIRVVKPFGLLVPALALLLAGGALAATSGGHIVQVRAKGSVSSAVARLKKEVAGHGMMVMGELNQGKVLSMTGLSVQSQSLFVGNPTVGKKLFTSERGAGVAVPVRINVYENAQGQTIVAYVPPSEILSGFGNPMLNKVTHMLDQKLRMLVEGLAK